MVPAGLLHAAGVRSLHARARIRSIDVSRARAQRGVHLVLTAAELGALNQPTPLLIPHPELTHPRTPCPLAADEVRYAGELIALVVADDRYLAEDTARLIDVEYEPLPAVVELEAAGAAGAPRVHADVPGNRAARVAQRVGDPDGAFARAAHVFRERLAIERSCGSPLETRGVVADYDARTGMLNVWISTQAPLPIKNGLARLFGLPEFKVEVIAPDVGGGFGTKIMLFYPEEILIPAAAIRLGRAVKWIEDRSEHLTSSSQERGQLHEVEVAADEAGRILALRDRFLHDAGAYTPYGIIVPLITSTQLPGPYRLRHYDVEFEVRYTNKVMVTPYRGAGRPHGAFVMERMIGRIARELGLEPSEVRRRNFIQPDEFPWDVGLTFQDGGPTRYDSGDYPAGLEMALERIDFGNFRARQRTVAAANVQTDFLLTVGILLRIRQKIDDDLRHRIAVGVNGQAEAGQLALELESIVFQVRAIGLSGVARDRNEIAIAQVVFLFAAFHAREIEHVIDQPRQSCGLGGDDLKIRTLLGGVRHAAFGQQFGKHANRSERSFQFVRDVADEIGFLTGKS